MRKLLTFLTVLFFFAFVVSCKKSNSSTSGGGGGSVQGNWKFLYLTAQTQNSATSYGVTEVTKSNYTTTNNSGTFSFTADSAIVTNLAYTMTFNAESYVYISGVLQDSMAVPFSETVPAVSETSAYKQIGNDSLYFPAGGFSSLATTGTTIASGGRYVINNDTLKLTVQFSESAQGVSVTANETVYLLKQ